MKKSKFDCNFMSPGFISHTLPDGTLIKTSEVCNLKNKYFVGCDKKNCIIWKTWKRDNPDRYFYFADLDLHSLRYIKKGRKRFEIRRVK